MGSATAGPEGTVAAMLLHLTAPAEGARLAVCDRNCARRALAALPHLVATVTEPERPPATHCVRCVACGGIIDEPITRPCPWHPEGCPAWEYTHTTAGAEVVRRLSTHDQVIIRDADLTLIERIAVLLTAEGGPPDPSRWYDAVRCWLAPPPE